MTLGAERCLRSAADTNRFLDEVVLRLRSRRGEPRCMNGRVDVELPVATDAFDPDRVDGERSIRVDVQPQEVL